MAKASASADSSNPKRILVVDDDRTVLDVISRVLAKHRLLLARDPDEALHAASQVGHVDLLITDYMMPSMTGEELIGRLREQWPALRVLVLTAHSDILDAENSPWWARETHLGKPFEAQQLRNVVEKLLGA